MRSSRGRASATPASESGSTIRGDDRALGAARRLVAFRRPSWSEDGGTIFVGVAPWAEKTAPAKKDKDAADPGDRAIRRPWTCGIRATST